MPSITLVKGDANYILEFTVTDANGDNVDITGASVIFKMQKYNQSTLTLNKAGSVTNGTLGYCQILIGTELVNKSGRYRCELEIEWSYGMLLTAPEINCTILKDLPK